MVDLNSYLPSGSPFIELNSANAVSADGTIVGVGTAVDGQAHAFTWQTGLFGGLKSLPVVGAPN
jgi:probable HAF family extracellular repeat protein